MCVLQKWLRTGEKPVLIPHRSLQSDGKALQMQVWSILGCSMTLASGPLSDLALLSGRYLMGGSLTFTIVSARGTGVWGSCTGIETKRENVHVEGKRVIKDFVKVMCIRFGWMERERVTVLGKSEMSYRSGNRCSVDHWSQSKVLLGDSWTLWNRKERKLAEEQMCSGYCAFSRSRMDSRWLFYWFC